MTWLNRVGIILNVLAGFLLAPQLIGEERIARSEQWAERRVKSLHERQEARITRIHGSANPFFSFTAAVYGGVGRLMLLAMGGLALLIVLAWLGALAAGAAGLPLAWAIAVGAAAAWAVSVALARLLRVVSNRAGWGFRAISWVLVVMLAAYWPGTLFQLAHATVFQARYRTDSSAGSHASEATAQSRHERCGERSGDRNRRRLLRHRKCAPVRRDVLATRPRCRAIE